MSNHRLLRPFYHRQTTAFLLSLYPSSSSISSINHMNMDSLQRSSVPNAEADCNFTRPAEVGTVSLRRGDCAAHDISAEEEDLIHRLHRLLGDRWELIAGRLPWRSVEEIKNYCQMRYTATASSSRS